MSEKIVTGAAIRLATRKRTQAAIERRKEEIAAFRQASYAEILTRAIAAEKVRTEGDKTGNRQARTDPYVGQWERTGQGINGRKELHRQIVAEGKKKIIYEEDKPNQEKQITSDPTAGEGWIEVRRKRLTKPKENPLNSLYKCKGELLSQGRCFRCLAKGHRRYQCMGKLRCLKCKLIGHTAGRCKVPVQNNNENMQRNVNAQPPENPPLRRQHIKMNDPPQREPKSILVKQPEQETRFILVKPQQETRFILVQPKERKTEEKIAQNTEMDPLAHWETMRMVNPEYIQSNRVEELRVFLSKKELNHSNEFLERSATVLTGPNVNDMQLRRRLQQKFAYHFKCHPRQFKIGKIPSSTGDLLAVFPTADMRKQAVDICVFKLGLGVEVQLATWTREIGMVHDPTTHKVRLRLHGAPFHLWNWENLTELVSGFGTLEKFAPVFDNDNFEELRILVGCHHPIQVPPYLTAAQDNHSVTIQVEVEGWIHNDVLTTEPNYNGGERTDDNQYDKERDEAHYWDTQWKNSVRENMRRRGQNSYDSGQSSGTVTQYKRRDRTGMREEPVYGTMEMTGQNRNGEEAKSMIRILVNRMVLCVQNGNKIQIHGRCIKDAVSTEKLFQIVIDGPEIRGMYYSVFSKITELTGTGARLIQLETNQEGEKRTNAEGQHREKSKQQAQAQFFNSQDEITQAFLTEAAQAQLEIEQGEEQQSHPPGFPGPPKFKNSARRSPRLGEKYKGDYTTPEERARRVSRPDSAPIMTAGHKKKNVVCQAQLEYFKSYGPLSQTQADLVLMAAGIGPKDNEADQPLALTA